MIATCKRAVSLPAAYLFLLVAAGMMGCQSNPDEIRLFSPDHTRAVSIELHEGTLRYQVRKGKEEVIAPSQLGMVFKDGSSLTEGLKIVNISYHTHDESWTQPWGEVKIVNDRYQACTISLASETNDSISMDVTFRAYDDGVAFRYHITSLGGKKTAIIQDELTEFNLPEDATAWWIKAYQPNRYEYLYQSTRVSEMDTVHTPLTLRYKSGLHLSIHEASLVDYSSMQIASRQPTSLHCDLAPWSNGDKVRTSVPFYTPWRTITIGDSAADLVRSTLVLNCNEPNKLGDVSWIKPSKYIGIWWGMIIGKWTWAMGPRHGATTERSKKYIDFAAQHGFDEVLVEGTSAGFTALFAGDTVTTNFSQTTSDFDLEEVQQYAKARGVSLQAYHETSAGTHNYLAQMDSAFAQMNSLGIQKAKIGHVGHLLDKREYHYGQYGVNYYRKVLQKAAQYKVAINLHEPIKDTGERRTYPNMLSREGAKGMEYNAWGNNGNPPAHTATLPFTRLLGSPMDFTPGIFDLLYHKLDQPQGNEVPVTLTVLDHGNGYRQVRYKGAESYWQYKPMHCDTLTTGSDTIFKWTVVEMMRPGEWEWGASGHDVASDNNNFWLLSTGDLPNRQLTIDLSGNISGQTSFTIPDLGIPSSQKRSNLDLDPHIDMNVFGVTQRVNSTLAKQLALYVVIYSPIQMAADFIENYEQQPAFQFIKEVPVDWDTTIVIHGEIGEYVTIARKDRHSRDWYLGSITNEKARSFEIDMGFLDPNATYRAISYADSLDADWRTNPYAIAIDSQEVGDSYPIILAKGGGHAVRFRYIGKRE